MSGKVAPVDRTSSMYGGIESFSPCFRSAYGGPVQQRPRKIHLPHFNDDWWAWTQFNFREPRSHIWFVISLYEHCFQLTRVQILIGVCGFYPARFWRCLAPTDPAHDLQAMDRAYRFGQQRDVHVYRLLGAGSLEELIYARQLYKQQQMRIAYEASLQTRYFTAVQGDKKRQGELFGIKNIFKLNEAELPTKHTVSGDLYRVSLLLTDVKCDRSSALSSTRNFGQTLSLLRGWVI